MTSKILVSAAAALLTTLASTALSPNLNQSPITPITCQKTCQVTNDLVQLLSHLEGYSPFIYKDSAGNDTIGIGHLITAHDHIQEPLLPPDASKLLANDLQPKAADVNKAVQRPLYQNQFNALVSFTFNVGTGNLHKSQLLRKVNANDDAAVPSQFMHWTHAGDEVIEGLIIRRRAEANLYAATPKDTSAVSH